MTADAIRDAIATRAADKFVGQPAFLCPQCKSHLMYANDRGGISCRTCQPPKFKSYVRLPLVALRIDGKLRWADGREENHVAKWSSQCGVDPQVLRDYLAMIRSLPIGELNGCELVWPPDFAQT